MNKPGQLIASSVILCLILSNVQAQQNRVFTKADTLRGSINAARSWWNVLRYDLFVQPDYLQKTISGVNKITYRVLKNNAGIKMQIDLKEPLQIDSVLCVGDKKVSFTKEDAVWYLNIPQQTVNSIAQIAIFYTGKVHEAIRAPWDGGWTFTKDSLGRPWMTVTCQGLGASIWYPCKDHQSDEPENGASLTMRVPDSLMAVANGRRTLTIPHGDGTTSYRWEVKNPINNYNLIPYIGKYVHFNNPYQGEKGLLDVDYWVLDYNETKAKSYLPTEVTNMFKSLEYWFGPYPFYKDGYKLVDVPHTGMEHQSAIAYGNNYKPGYRLKDGSGTGWGLKWDFIVVHESAHEWFGNSITSNDLADMWIHEGFANYSETLFVDYMFGTQAANEYNVGIRKGIRNDRPIISPYGVNSQGSGDMYPKGGNMLHAIRHSIDNDKLFRKIIRGVNQEFYHATVNSSQIESYFSNHAGFNYSAVFDQYLRTTQIPLLEITIDSLALKVSCRYINCLKGFNLPVILNQGTTKTKLFPTTQWSTVLLTSQEIKLINTIDINKMYYIESIVSNKK